MGIKSERINKVKELTSSVSGSSARLITNENFKLLSRAIVDIIDELDIDLINNIHINNATLDGTLNTSLGLNVNNGNFTVNAMGQMFAQGGIYTPLAHISRLRLDPDTNPAAIQAGEIRWTGSDFVGWTGSTWESFLNGGGSGGGGFFPNGLEIVTVSRDFQSSDAGKRLMLSGTDISVTMPAINPFAIGDYVGVVSDGLDCAFTVENGGDLIYPLKTGDGSTSECVVLMNTDLQGDQWLLPISTSFIYDNVDSKKKTALKHLYDNIRLYIGAPIIGAVPNLFLYTDNSGNLYQDGLATRDSVTNETYIGYRTGAGQFTNAFTLGNIAGGLIQDGAGLQRHDSINDTFSIIGAFDMTPFGGSANTLFGAYADFTNGIFATTKLSNIESVFDYSNSVTGTDGNFGVNDTQGYVQHTDNTTYQAKTYWQSDKIQARFEDITTGRIMKDIVDGTSVRAGDFGSTGNKMSYTLDDANRYFQVFGLKNTSAPSSSSITFTGTGLDNIIVDFSSFSLTTPTTYSLTIDSIDADIVEYATTSITGAGFIIGEPITSSSGGFAVITAINNNAINGFQYLTLTSKTGTFLLGDNILGTTSFTSATLNSDSYQEDTYSWNDGGSNSGTLVPCKIPTGKKISGDIVTNFYRPRSINDNWVFTISPGITSYGNMLKLDAQNETMEMGDVTNISSHVKVVTDTGNGVAYIDGLASPVPNWTPSTLSDGFTGTGLNDMHYDSTTTYTGTYPNTYAAGIASVNSVYIYLTSITTPGFTVGDTVTDGASTGTIIAGSDGDGFIIIQPIIDSGWTSATSITDISSGAASSVGGLYYTDTMSWSSTDGGSGIIIPTSSVIKLGDGLTVGFGSQTGHTLGDLWEWTMLQGTVYSKMALFDGANRTMSIGDVEQTANDVRTDWVLGTGKNHGIYEYLGDAQVYLVSNSVGNLLVLDSDTFNQTVVFNIEDPFNGQTPFSVETDDGAYGFGFQLFDAGQHSATLGAPTVGNNTFLRVDDDTKTITLAARHISAPLSAYADDADAGTNGVVTGELYQTDGTGSAPLNIAGIVMIKQ